MSRSVPDPRRAVTLSRLTDSVLFISASREGRHLPFGSGVVIGPHLGLTALHVMKDIYKQLQGDEIRDTFWSGIKYPNPKFEVKAWRHDQMKVTMRGYWVRAFSGSRDGSDIAVLCLQPLDDDRAPWPIARMTLVEWPPDTDI